MTPLSDLGVKPTGRGGARHTLLIAESGLYKLVLRSDKPQAKAFQDWVTRVVLPAIRKDGALPSGSAEGLDRRAALWFRLQQPRRAPAAVLPGAG